MFIMCFNRFKLQKIHNNVLFNVSDHDILNMLLGRNTKKDQQRPQSEDDKEHSGRLAI